MKKVSTMVVLCMMSIAAIAQTSGEKGTVTVYCDVMCVQYNLFKQDVNALVDFGIAEKGKHANGWIYNSDNNKKYSFASPMSVFSFMSRHGWEYKDTIIGHGSVGTSNNDSNVWHFIMSKEVPVDYTPDDVIGDIDYRNK